MYVPLLVSKVPTLKCICMGQGEGGVMSNNVCLFPDHPQKSGRGSGVLNNTFCHIRQGCKECNDYLFLNLELEFLMPQCIGTTVYKSLR